KNFCVITPYDAQKAEIARDLQSVGLPSDRVFNVDSFQGNEADYVLVSMVRTENAGFLKSLPRLNVLLTRCRRGMVIVTSPTFLSGPGRELLLADL
ncbi:AAA domain-containing protein, partial [Schizophyllum commune]